MKTDTLYKRTTTGKIQTWFAEVEGNKYRTTSGQMDGKKVVSEWTEVQGKNIGQSNETSPEEQARLEIEAKVKHQKEKGYTEEAWEVDNHAATIIKPMLAKKYVDYKNELQYPLWTQPKLDGIRCIITKDGAFSRNNKKFATCAHLVRALEPFFKATPDVAFDGELYADKFSDDFNEICSLVKRSKHFTPADIEKIKQNLQYHVYDLYQIPSIYSARNFSFRYSVLEEYSRKWADCIKLVETRKVESEDELNLLYWHWIEQGYEGQMVRLDADYQNKRSGYLLKRKEFFDDEYKILEIGEGVGNRSGTAGYMVCELHDGSDTFRTNIKGSHAYLAKVLANKANYIGKLATIRYPNLTPAGKPRFPFVIKIDRQSYE